MKKFIYKKHVIGCRKAFTSLSYTAPTVLLLTFGAPAVQANCLDVSTCARTATGDGLTPSAAPYTTIYTTTPLTATQSIGNTSNAYMPAGGSLVTTGNQNGFVINGGKLFLDGTVDNRISITNSATSSGPSSINTSGVNGLTWANYLDITLTGQTGSRGAYGVAGGTTVLNNVRINQAGTGTGHVSVISESAGGRMYFQDSSVVTNGGSDAIIAWKAATARTYVSNSHVGLLNMDNASIGIGANTGAANYVDDSKIYSQGNNHIGANAKGGSQIYLNGDEIVMGVKLGTNAADWTTYGRPVDAAGNLITDPL